MTQELITVITKLQMADAVLVEAPETLDSSSHVVPVLVPQLFQGKDLQIARVKKKKISYRPISVIVALYRFWASDEDLGSAHLPISRGNVVVFQDLFTSTSSIAGPDIITSITGGGAQEIKAFHKLFKRLI
jgi:hypothetical protein